MTTTDIYTLSLHDALPIWDALSPEVLLREHVGRDARPVGGHRHAVLLEDDGPVGVADLRRARLEAHAVVRIATRDRKSTRLNSSHTVISYAVFCLKKKTHQ